MSTTLLPTQNSGTQPPSTHGILEIAQAQELQSRTIRTNAEAHEFFRARLDAEIKQHQKDIEAFNKRLTELNVREQEVNTKSEKTNKTWLEASEAEEKAKKLNEENAKQKALLDPLIAQGEEIKTRKEAAEQAESKAASDKKEAEEAQASTKAMLAQIQDIASKTSELHPTLFPACLSTDAWRPWQKSLLDQWQNSAAGFALAAFATFCVAEKSNDPDELVQALRELGRRLYAFFPDTQTVNRISDTLTKAYDGRVQLKCPQIGEPTNLSSMNFRPGLTTVEKVQNWGILKRSGEPAFKAEVA